MISARTTAFLADAMSAIRSKDTSTTRDLGKTMKKKLSLSKETLRTLDEEELSLIVGGASGGNKPKCPNTKAASCDCNTNGAVCHP